MALTGSKLRDALCANFGFTVDDADRAIVDKAFARVRLVADASAGVGADGTIIIGITDRAFMVDLIGIISPTAVAADEASTGGLTFSKSDGAGGPLVPIGTWGLNAAGGGALEPLRQKSAPLTATTGDRLVAAGSVITVAKTPDGLGAAIPAGSKIIVEGYWA